MRKHLLIASLVLGMYAGAANATLVITGVIDGDLSGGLPKAVEFYKEAVKGEFYKPAPNLAGGFAAVPAQ